MSELYRLFCAHPHVSTDTRRIEAGSLFFALHGASFDGNRFAAEALEKGAVAAVVDDPSVAVDDRFILVGDTLRALQELAREHRLALGIPIFAIAGSSGKTTTKELVSAVLKQRFPHLEATRGNLNNHIGVPLTLLAMTAETEMGVVEMGASACGELALLIDIVRPNCGILTNVGRSHLEGFGGPEGIRRGKGEVYDWFAAHGGRVFVRAEDDTLCAMAAERQGLQVEFYATSLAEGFPSRLEGDYNRFNVAAAVAIGRYFGVGEEQIRRAIADYIPSNNRSQRVTTARNTLVVDCYNANPSSMQLSVASFLAEPLGARSRKVLILGDMLELGSWSQQEHTAILQQLATTDADLRLVGAEFARACAALPAPLPQATLYPSREELAAALAAEPVANALILVKGSRGIGLEQLVELL